MPLKYYRILSFLVFLVLMGWFVAAIESILLPFVFGILIAYFFDPTADRLERMGFSRTTATSLILIVFFSVLVLGLVAIVPRLTEQLASLIATLPEKLDALERMARPYINRILLEVGPVDFDQATEQAAGLSHELLGAGGKILTGVVKSGMAIANLAALLVIAPVVSFYLLRDWDQIIAQMDTLLPRYHAETIREQVREIDRVIAGFVRGQLRVCFTLALFYAVTLSLAGLQYALLISLLAGILIIIPYAGTFISGVLAVSVALFQFDGELTHVGIVLGIFITGQMLEGYILTPRLMGRSIGLHPMWIIFGMLAGGALMGFVGVLIAVPVTAVIGVLVRFAVRTYLHSPLYHSGAVIRIPEETL